MLRPARLAVPLAVLMAITACGGGDELAVPPKAEADIAEVVQRFFDPLGLEFTYGSVDDFPGGPHLAMYVEPTGPATDQEYLDRLLASGAAVVPAIFEAYPDLNSLDICQEPVPTGPDDDPRPTPRTILVLTKRQSDRLDWDTATLADVIVAVRAGRGTEVRVDDAIEALPDYAAAFAEADRRSPLKEGQAGYDG